MKLNVHIYTNNRGKEKSVQIDRGGSSGGILRPHRERMAMKGKGLKGKHTRMHVTERNRSEDVYLPFSTIGKRLVSMTSIATIWPDVAYNDGRRTRVA